MQKFKDLPSCFPENVTTSKFEKAWFPKGGRGKDFFILNSVCFKKEKRIRLVPDMALTPSSPTCQVQDLEGGT